tara:strand:- start:5961 stop:6131 length:171 start_codon:yes stop_codon:yes gene_type:complete
MTEKELIPQDHALIGILEDAYIKGYHNGHKDTVSGSYEGNEGTIGGVLDDNTGHVI